MKIQIYKNTNKTVNQKVIEYSNMTPVTLCNK